MTLAWAAPDAHVWVRITGTNGTHWIGQVGEIVVVPNNNALTYLVDRDQVEVVAVQTRLGEGI